MKIELSHHEESLAREISEIIQSDNEYGKQLSYSAKVISQGMSNFLMSISTDSTMSAEEKGLVMTVTGSITKALNRSLREHLKVMEKKPTPKLKSDR